MFSQKNKKKYGSFGNYVLQDDKVFKWLYISSIIFPAVIYTLFLYTLWYYKQWEMFVILSIFAFFVYKKIYKFFRYGGLKTVPKLNANEYVWGRK